MFFSRVSLRNKVSEHYEPYIYNALKTAKVMIVFGEKPEYFNAVWVKNEWMRFRKRIELGEKNQNSLVVAYKGFDPADLPVGLRSRQCLDAGSMTFLEDLKRHIAKIVREPKKVEEPKAVNEPKMVNEPKAVEEPAAKVEAPEKPRSKKGIIIAAIALVLAVCIGLGFVVSDLANGEREPDSRPEVPLVTEAETTETKAETEKITDIETQRETDHESASNTEIGDPGDYTYTECSETVYVNNPGSAITFRTEEYEAICQISHGTKLLRIGISTDSAQYWSKVIFDGQEGYIASKFLTNANPIGI